MRRTGRGAIVNHTSLVGMRGMGGLYPAASASQAAIIGLTLAAAAGAARYDIRVNALAIGAVDTGTIGSLDPATKEAMAAHVPLGRLGQGTDVAAQAAWLCSDYSSWVTGSILPVDGGAAAQG